VISRLLIPPKGKNRRIELRRFLALKGQNILARGNAPGIMIKIESRPRENKEQNDDLFSDGTALTIENELKQIIT